MVDRAGINSLPISELLEMAAVRPDVKAEAAARRFLDLLPPRYAVAGAILFGSRARRDADRDSDADLAILLRGPPGDRADAAVAMAGLAFDVMLETGVLVDPLPLWEDEWNHPEGFGNPALIAAFGRHLVQPSLVDVDLGRILNQVERIRLLADYTGEPIGLEKAVWAVQRADALLDCIDGLLSGGRGGSTAE